jgi:hypothetical protein
MAEVIVIIGGVAACTQLAKEFLRLSDKLRRSLKFLRNAPQLIFDLREETTFFATCLKKLIQAANKAYSSDAQVVKAQEITDALRYVTAQGRRIGTAIRTLLRDFSGWSSASKLQEWLSKLRLAFRQPQLQFLQSTLSKVKQDVYLLALTVTLDLLLQKAAHFEAKGLKVPKELTEDMYVLWVPWL